MAISTESFKSILDRALTGELQLPEFQRDYVWRRPRVVELFDSLRQRYPIGALLFMERNPDVEIVPRPFEGTADLVEKDKKPDAFVLDGQQRITAGLSLFHGLGPSQYYLDLAQIWRLAQERGVDFRSSAAVSTFLADLEPDDAYCVGRNRRADPFGLISQDLLFTAALSDALTLNDLLRKYLERHPDRQLFVDTIRDAFRLGGDVYVPVTLVEKNRPVEAVSRIFATLNTTGQPLNSFELVVALLYPRGIRLRSDIEVNRELYPVYDKMDRTGEVFLQTIALLANVSPKKSLLPKTIREDRYRRYGDEAVGLLDELGRFLTERMGLGLDRSASLIPYDSIFAPMAIVWKHIVARKLQGVERTKAYRKLEQWFVVSSLSQRYQEGVHNKQVKDSEDMIRWIDSDDLSDAPPWISQFKISSLRLATPDGAVGKLIRCLINRRHPRDPITEREVGEHHDAVVSAKHHIFPTRWADQYLPGFVPKRDSVDLALNVTIVSQETNARWVNVDPANQVQEMREAAASSIGMSELLRDHFLDERCVEIMSRPDKKKSDFDEFLIAREAIFASELRTLWGVEFGGVPGEDLDEG